MEKHTPKFGRLDLIIGPMFSGKSSELIRRIRKYRLCSYNCALVKYDADNRYSNDLVMTHDGKRMTAINCHELYQIISVEQYDVIGIDEGQFFSDIFPFCYEYLKKGKIMIVAGLDATYLRTGFDNILALVPFANNVDKLSAICMSCGRNASFTKRISEEDEIEVVGGLDKYMAVCRDCYKIPLPPKRTPFKSSNTPTFSEVSKLNYEPPCKRQICI